MKNAASWVAIALTALGMVVTAVVWVPSQAQEAVKTHKKDVDDDQDAEIKALRLEVQELMMAQAITNERLKSQNEKLDKIIAKLE